MRIAETLLRAVEDPLGALATLVRLVCSFVLAFSCTLGAQTAYAVGGGSQTAAPAESYVSDLGIYDADHPAQVIAYASSTNAGAIGIDERGGQLDLDAVAYWNDGSAKGGYADVTWATDDASVAQVNAKTGVLTAKGDGTCTLTCTSTDSSATDGATLVARATVTVTGQQDAPYVVSIQICDESGQVIDPSYVFHEDTDLSTATLELEARVTVHDPATGANREYLVTPESGLSAQTGGALPDLAWTVADSSGSGGALSSISAEGIFRPQALSSTLVYCTSMAGEGNTRVQDEATIIMPGSSNATSDEAHPQDTLTIEASWESDPDTVVLHKVYSVDDLEALGTHVRSYTAFGQGRFMTLTGRGPYLDEVLRDAGLDTSGGVKSLSLICYDGTFPISYDMLVDTDRYYFPNMDIGSYADAEQVPAMIAIDSKKAWDSSAAFPADQLTSDTRFRLLFGAKESGETTTRYQINWIREIKIVLAGAPPVQPDDNGDGSGTDGGDAGSGGSAGGDAGGGAGDSTQGAGVSDAGADSGGGDGGGSGSEAADAARAGVSGGNGDVVQAVEDATGSGSSEADAQASEQASSGDGQSASDDGAASADGDATGRANQGAWSVLQAVNDNKSIVDSLYLDNPLAPFAAPVAAGALAAGIVEVTVRYRLQKRMPRGV